MSRVPGVRCPECGLEWEESQLTVCPATDRGWPANCVLILSFIVAWLFQTANEALPMLSWIGASWVIAGWWVWLRRRSIFSSKPWLLWWIAYLSGGAAVVGGVFPRLSWLEWTPAVVAVAVVVFGLSVAPRRFLVGTGVAILWLTCLYGAGIFVLGLSDMAPGLTNHRFEFLGESELGTFLDLIVIGVGLAIIGIGVIGLVLVRRARPIRRP